MGFLGFPGVAASASAAAAAALTAAEYHFLAALTATNALSHTIASSCVRSLDVGDGDRKPLKMSFVPPMLLRRGSTGGAGQPAELESLGAG